MPVSQEEKDVLRILADEYAQISSLSVHQETIKNWKRLNALDPVKPMVLIDQICWPELNTDGQLTLQCEDDLCRSIEWTLRSTIYKWNHFPCDMVVMPYVEIPKTIRNSGYGIDIQFEDGADGELHLNPETHLFADQIPDEAALERIAYPQIEYDEEKTLANQAAAENIFGDIIPVRMTGVSPEFRTWDELTFFRGVTPILYDFVDRPDFLHAIMEKFTDIQLHKLEQYERLNLVEKDVATIHCSGTFTDELPAEDFDGIHVRGVDSWAYGMGQIFSSCSAEMFYEFEIQYAKKYYERCGLVNYGCCEPLHDKVHLIGEIDNVRKISTSPWSNVEIMAKNLGSDYVLLRKSNPAFVASDTLDEQSIRKETAETLAVCQDNSTPCEFILKDLTTVRQEPQRLTRWAEIVKEEIEK